MSLSDIEQQIEENRKRLSNQVEENDMEEKEKGLFENIGNKVKTLAYLICLIGIIGSVISGLYMINYEPYHYGGKPLEGIGWVTLIVGPLVSWIGSWSLFAIGSAADDAAETKQMMKQLIQKIEQMNADHSEKTDVSILEKTVEAADDEKKEQTAVTPAQPVTESSEQEEPEQEPEEGIETEEEVKETAIAEQIVQTTETPAQPVTESSEQEEPEQEPEEGIETEEEVEETAIAEQKAQTMETPAQPVIESSEQEEPVQEPEDETKTEGPLGADFAAELWSCTGFDELKRLWKIAKQVIPDNIERTNLENRVYNLPYTQKMQGPNADSIENVAKAIGEMVFFR